MSDQLPVRNHRQNGRAYGARLADCFCLPEPPSHELRTARLGVLSVSEMVVNFPMTEPTASIGYEDAFAVTVHLKDLVDHEYWLNGRAIHCEPISAGQTYIHDLRQDPRALVRQPERTVHYYMPLATLNAFAEQEGVQRISDLIYKPGFGRDDPTMLHLSEAVLQMLAKPHGTSGLFLDQILTAACAHVLGQYGTARAILRRAAGALAPWQEQRAKEMMNEYMDAHLSLSELARECRLSVTHFARAFRQSTGMSPHQWLVARRIEKAVSMLDETDLTLAEIALACGFCDQSHLTKVFSDSVGMSPGRWRRSQMRG
jgi:AraC family transcriptional regulator